jgi:transcription elongation GreA/GreB family factor
VALGSRARVESRRTDYVQTIKLVGHRELDRTYRINGFSSESCAIL